MSELTVNDTQCPICTNEHPQAIANTIVYKYLYCTDCSEKLGDKEVPKG